MNKKWELMLSSFRHLGGIAENVCQKEGEFGRGIFSINPRLKSKIYTPSKLMIKKEDIFLEENKLRIKKNKNYNKEIRDFFNYYQDNFSWGGGGKENTDFFEKGLRFFPNNLKKLIKKYILVDLEERHQGKWENVIKKQFLNARGVRFGTESVISPVWELVNHEVISLSFISSPEGLSTPNYPPMNGEITFAYNDKSSLNRFFSYGFFSKETMVFSFPFSIALENLGMNLICKGQEINDDSMSIERSDNEVKINGFPIADLNNSRLPTNYLDEILRKIGAMNISSKNLLKNILELNVSARKNLLAESMLVDNEVSSMFSKIINYEIDLISFFD